MIYLSTFLYYFCFGSVVLFSGIGSTRTTQLEYFKSKNVLFYTKIFITITVSSILSWLITDKILVPLKLVEIYPIISFLVMVCIAGFLEAIVRLTTNNSTTEFIFSYLVILLTVSESNSILNVLIISTSCFLSLFVIVCLVYTFKFRVGLEELVKEKYLGRLLLFLAILLFIISVWDIMWMNPEVLR